MFSYIAVLSLFSFFLNVSSEIAPCKLSDPDCLNRIGAEAYSKYIDADPVLKTESLDPMHHDLIVGNLTLLQFEVTNSTVLGFKDCKMENLKIVSEGKLHFDMRCPKLLMFGKYKISGKLIVIPVEGTGDYKIESKKYLISVDADFKLVPGADGKTHLSIKDFKQNAEPLDPVTFDFQNLFNGRKDLADVVLKFANDNWMTVAKEVQTPVLSADFKKLFKNANKYFKTIPVEN